MAARQRRLIREKRRFVEFNWLLWQRPLTNRTKLNEVNKGFHLSTNPEILVKICLLDSEKQPVEYRPLKIECIIMLNVYV